MRMLTDRLLVVPDPADNVSAGGIVIPEQAQHEAQRGSVEAVGPEVEFIEEGERVVFSKYGGTRIDLDGKEFLVLRPTDILVVL